MGSPLHPALLLHSGGMSSRQWRKLADVLGTKREVRTADFLGSGENPPWPADKAFHFLEDAVVIERAIVELGSPVHLVGHSYGGLIALSLARRIPELVSSLALYDPVAFGVLYAPPDAAGLADLERASVSEVFLDPDVGGTDPWFEVFVDYWNGPGAWRALSPAARASFLRVGKKVFCEVRSLMDDRTPASAYAGVNVPTLLLRGEHSPTAARRVVEILEESMPNAHAIMVPEAGHMGPLTHAAFVNAAIEKHIEFC